MYKKHWAWLFIFLVSSTHVGNTFGHGVMIPESEQGCKIEAKLILVINQCMEEVRLKVKKVNQVEDTTVQDFSISDCQCEGLHQIKITDCGCTCYKDFIRIFIFVSIFDVVFSFFLSLNGIVGGILSGVINLVVGLLQEVVNLLVELLCVQIDIVIVVDWHFINGKCLVKDIYISRIGTLKILNLNLKPLLMDALHGLISDLLIGVFAVFITEEFKGHIMDAFTKVTIENDWHSCHTPPHPPNPPCHTCDD